MWSGEFRVDELFMWGIQQQHRQTLNIQKELQNFNPKTFVFGDPVETTQPLVKKKHEDLQLLFFFDQKRSGEFHIQDPIAIFVMVMGSALSFLMQLRLFAYAAWQILELFLEKKPEQNSPFELLWDF